MCDAKDTTAAIFSLSEAVRYVASYRRGVLTQTQRPNLSEASTSESDKYEELFVNPALLKLVKQRGDLDCGGSQFVLVRYGNFYQLVLELNDGHLSVCFEPDSNPLAFVSRIQAICQ